jgi:hypothetical protein
MQWNGICRSFICRGCLNITTHGIVFTLVNLYCPHELRMTSRPIETANGAWLGLRAEIHVSAWTWLSSLYELHPVVCHVHRVFLHPSTQQFVIKIYKYRTFKLIKTNECLSRSIELGRFVNIYANAELDVLTAVVTNEFCFLGYNDVQSQERQFCTAHRYIPEDIRK